MTTLKTSHHYPANLPENTRRAQAKPLVQQRTSQSNDASELPGARTTTTTNSLSHTTSHRQPIHPDCGQLALHPPQASAQAASSWRRQRMPASMNASISPSKTASVLPVSKFVRRSLTIWYGCST